jgi:3-hydroxyacyl-CoA dehydrogenase
MDVAMKVIQGMKANCPEDKMIRDLKIPDFFKYLVDNNYLGNKSGQGFYKKTEERDENGKRIILALDLKTQEYSKPQKDNLPSLSLSKQIDDPAKRIKALFESEDIGGQFIRRSLLALFSYASQRIPEVTDHLYSVDQALREGFGWEYGPFEYWDLLGVERCLELAETEGFVIADWVREMLKAGHPSFYQWTSNGRAFYGNQTHWGYHPLIEHQSIVHLRTTEEKPAVYKNDEITVHDIGDGILCLEFQSKMNAIGEGILNGLNETLALAEEQGWKGLVIGNHAPNYSVGANLMLMGMMAFQQQYDMLHMAVKLFQDTSMRCRYSNIPVVVATQGYVFGGGCEMAMHCDSIVAAAESYIGQVEVGVGLLPGGGGTKEFALRAGDSFFEGDVEIPTLIKYFKSLATGYVATSAHEALEAGYLSHHRDEVVMHKARNIGEAKKKALALSEGYLPPVPRKDITVLGRTGLAALYIAANELKRGGWASEHDIKIAKKIAYVMCGGDLSEKQQVDEQYLLDLEREAFMSLCTEPKTLERIQFMLEKGKPLRN